MTFVWFIWWWLAGDFSGFEFADVSGGDKEMWLVLCVSLDLLIA